MMNAAVVSDWMLFEYDISSQPATIGSSIPRDHGDTRMPPGTFIVRLKGKHITCTGLDHQFIYFLDGNVPTWFGLRMSTTNYFIKGKESSMDVPSPISDTCTTPSTKSLRVSCNLLTNDGFKARLVYRDQGCLVCKAAGEPLWRYGLQEDSGYFEGHYIFPLEYCTTVSPSNAPGIYK